MRGTSSIVALTLTTTSIFACDKAKETNRTPKEALPTPSASVVTAEVTASASASATPAPLPPPTKLAGFPDVDLACNKDADCATSYLAEDCCDVCAARVVSKAWLSKASAFCAKKAADARCPKRRCSTWALGTVGCKAGRCAFR